MSIQETKPQPRAVLVVYEMTYMLENYDSFICGLGSHQSLDGVIFIKNTGLKTILQGLVLMLSLATPRLGWQILRNALFINHSWRRRQSALFDKKQLFVSTINDPKVISFIEENQINFLIHSRTTSIFRKNILDRLTYGAINVHHGILPRYRGLMCDFWAHFRKSSFGFSIHLMTSKIDDGPLLFVKEMQMTNSYLVSAQLSAIEEAIACRAILDELQANRSLKTNTQDKTDILYEKAPSIRHGYLIQTRGIKI